MADDSMGIIEIIGNLAYEYEHKYGGCSQCVIAAFKDSVGQISDDVIKAATGFMGGTGLCGDNCGALNGAVMVLSIFAGRSVSDFNNPEKMGFETMVMTKSLIDLFIEEYGSIKCYDIQQKLMGRTFNFWNQEEYAEFLAAGGHEDKCTSICQNSARWTAKMLLEKGLINKS